ncbi:MAG: hypothetical protein Q8N96_12575 [Methylovulum sp.]|nr:hypothetical protein [Methylovulum sp.]
MAYKSHRALLEQHGIRQGMSRKGNCWEGLSLGDNAVSKSFFHTLKQGQAYQNSDGAKKAIFEYVGLLQP